MWNQKQGRVKEACLILQSKLKQKMRTWPNETNILQGQETFFKREADLAKRRNEASVISWLVIDWRIEEVLKSLWSFFNFVL